MANAMHDCKKQHPQLTMTNIGRDDTRTIDDCKMNKEDDNLYRGFVIVVVVVHYRRAWKQVNHLERSHETVQPIHARQVYVVVWS